MRIQRSQVLTERWHTLPPAVRAFVQTLRRKPRPPDAMTIPGRPNYDEEFVDGFGLVWTVDDSGRETIIRVTVTE